MDDLEQKFKRRMLAFYFAGVINLVIGLYILLFGAQFMARGTALLVALFFLGFAAVDFYFPKLMKKKWEEARRQQGGGVGHPPQR